MRRRERLIVIFVASHAGGPSNGNLRRVLCLDALRRKPRPLDLAASRDGSTIVVDRDGRLLRPFTLPDGRWRLPATTHDVDPRYVAMLVAYEDGRFYEHNGVDLRALVRAGAQWLDARPRRLRRLDLAHAGRAAHRAAARAHDRGQAAADCAGARDRAERRQAGNARPLSHAGAVRRQSRGRARGLARLFRQGAAAAHPRRGGAAGRAAAVARSAAAGSFAQLRRARRATACSTGSPRVA